MNSLQNAIDDLKTNYDWWCARNPKRVVDKLIKDLEKRLPQIVREALEGKVK